LRVALAQIAPIVGAFEKNLGFIAHAYERACQAGARLVLTPELGICGYPPHDLVERPEIFEKNAETLVALAKLTLGKKCALVVGHVVPNPDKVGRSAQNVVSVLENGKEVFRQAKTLLPTYDVFDEARYFEPARDIHLWDCDGIKVAFAVCEDLWASDPAQERSLYRKDPVTCYAEAGAAIVFSVSASPYEMGKRERRESIHSGVAQRLGVPLVYVNQFGATDEILFDGGSFAVDAKGKLQGRLPMFQESFAVLEVDVGAIQWVEPLGCGGEADAEIATLHRALVTGVREYFARTNCQKALVGLSGGIDSAVVATLAVQALGAKNVKGVAMPSLISSAHSREDAEALAKNLGIGLEMRPIKFLFSVAARELGTPRVLSELAQENLQARLRGLILMTLSNNENALVLTTGNKSEIAMGYCTLYGDMVGALAPIGDLLKTQVYELARYINQAGKGVIPERSITKAPSAELRPNQTDQDSLPPYDQLDPLIVDYLEKRLSCVELVKKHGAWARETLSRLEGAEFKRLQAAPVLKVSRKAFGVGRRVPVAKTWHY